MAPYDPACFPEEIQHSSRQTLAIDRTRLVVFNLEAVTALSLGKSGSDTQRSFATALLESREDRFRSFLNSRELETSGLGFRLEDTSSLAFGENINQTPWQIWIRSENEEPITPPRTLIIEDKFRTSLGWANLLIAPVYRLPHTTGTVGLVSPLPHVLGIKLKTVQKDPLFNDRLSSRYGFMEADISHLLPNPYRCFVLRQPGERPVYQLRSKILQEENALIDDIFYDFLSLTKSAAQFSPNDFYYKRTSLPCQWNLKQIHADSGWNATTPPVLGKGVTVAVIDFGGCDVAHPDLNGAFQNPGLTIAYTGIQSIGGVAKPNDSHGTQCAGIIAARCDNAEGLAGIAGDCNILPIRIEADTDMVVSAAIGYASWAAGVKGPARVISMSFGGTTSSPLAYNGPLVRQSIKDAFDSTKGNTVLCAATMNDGVQNFIPYPAAYPEVIACGASTNTDGRADFTNYGEDPNTKGILSVVAPGVDIPTTANVRQGDSADGNYTERWPGTSAATPHVAALAALMICVKPAITSRQVKDLIEQTAEKVRSGTWNATVKANGSWCPDLGYGRIHVADAIKKAMLLP